MILLIESHVRLKIRGRSSCSSPKTPLSIQCFCYSQKQHMASTTSNFLKTTTVFCKESSEGEKRYICQCCRDSEVVLYSSWIFNTDAGLYRGGCWNSFRLYNLIRALTKHVITLEGFWPLPLHSSFWESTLKWHINLLNSWVVVWGPVVCMERVPPDGHCKALNFLPHPHYLLCVRHNLHDLSHSFTIGKVNGKRSLKFLHLSCLIYF